MTRQWRRLVDGRNTFSIDARRKAEIVPGGAKRNRKQLQSPRRGREARGAGQCRERVNTGKWSVRELLTSLRHAQVAALKQTNPCKQAHHRARSTGFACPRIFSAQYTIRIRGQAPYSDPLYKAGLRNSRRSKVPASVQPMRRAAWRASPPNDVRCDCRRPPGRSRHRPTDGPGARGVYERVLEQVKSAGPEKRTLSGHLSEASTHRALAEGRLAPSRTVAKVSHPAIAGRAPTREPATPSQLSGSNGGSHV